MKFRRRNPVAAAPILRKGGAHQKNRSAERAKTRAQLKRDIADWRPPRDDRGGGPAVFHNAYHRNNTHAGINIPSSNSL